MFGIAALAALCFFATAIAAEPSWAQSILGTNVGDSLTAGPAAIPVVPSPPGLPQIPGGNEVLTLFLWLASRYPLLATLPVLIGSLRIFIKPFATWIHSTVEQNPSAKEAVWLARFEHSIWWTLILGFLDYVCSIKPTTLARVLPGSATGAAADAGKVIALILLPGFLIFSPGCATQSPERTALNLNATAEDGVDAALKGWSISIKAREDAADALQASNPAEYSKRLAAINDEKLKVESAKDAYAQAEQSAIDGWLAARSNTNAPPVNLAGALAAAQAPFLSLLRQLTH